MRAADFDILTMPGWTGASPKHWMSRWETKLSTARRVEQRDWQTPRLKDWVSKIEDVVSTSDRPIVFVAHSCGVLALVHAVSAPDSPIPDRTAGAFLVAPPDLENMQIWPATDGGFANCPMSRLPFKTELVASATDPYCTLEKASGMAEAWGSTLRHAGDAGHINTDSGHGPWPEGSLAFALFVKSLRVH